MRTSVTAHKKGTHHETEHRYSHPAWRGCSNGHCLVLFVGSSQGRCTGWCTGADTLRGRTSPDPRRQRMPGQVVTPQPVAVRPHLNCPRLFAPPEMIPSATGRMQTQLAVTVNRYAGLLPRPRRHVPPAGISLSPRGRTLARTQNHVQYPGMSFRRRARVIGLPVFRRSMSRSRSRSAVSRGITNV